MTHPRLTDDALRRDADARVRAMLAVVEKNTPGTSPGAETKT